MDKATDRPGAYSHTDRVRFAFFFALNVPFWALMLWAIVALGDTGASEVLAVAVGMMHVSFGLTAAAVRASARFLDDAEEAEEVHREGRALLLGAGALVAAGSSLILLSLSGPGRLVPPAGGLAGALLLNALAWILVAVRSRRLDELSRVAEREAGSLAIGWLSLVGGTWAILAHLGFVPAPAPLDWLTMIWGFNFAAGIIAAARRGAFDTPASGSRSHD